jgi:hypothetical protein
MRCRDCRTALTEAGLAPGVAGGQGSVASAASGKSTLSVGWPWIILDMGVAA